MTSRKLTVRRERLAELSTAELTSVAGASGLPCDTESLIPTCGCTGHYPSILESCH